MNKKTIKLKFIGFWAGFDVTDNAIIDILKERYNVELSEDPDYVFVSVFEDEPYSYTQYDCVRIFYTGEPFSPDFTSFDYAIGYDNITFCDRYCYFPNSIFGLFDKEKLKGKSFEEANAIYNKKEYFCNFIYKHPTVPGHREAIFNKLQEYKRVESAGTFMNNMPDGKIIPFSKEKIEFLNKCKFTIASESMSVPGFTSEKIMQAYEGNTIPVYYGDPEITKVYNPNAFVHITDLNKLDEVLEKIIEIDNNKDLYIKMLMEPKLLDENYVDAKYEEFKTFLYNIFDQDKDKAYRRIRDYSAGVYLKSLKEMYLTRNSLPGNWYLKLKNCPRALHFFRFFYNIFSKVLK